MGWNAALPGLTTKVLLTSSLYLDNWTAMNDAISYEHYSMTSSLSGCHKPGIAGGTYVGTSAAISALTAAAGAGPGDGALAFSTTSGCALRFTESGTVSAWRNVGSTLPTSKVIAQGCTATIAVNTSGNVFSGGLLDADTLAEFNATTGIFTAKLAGYYLTTATVMATALSGTTWTIGLCGTRGWQAASSSVTTTYSGNCLTCSLAHLANLSGSEKLACYVQPVGSSMYISGPVFDFVGIYTPETTILSIYRVC